MKFKEQQRIILSNTGVIDQDSKQREDLLAQLKFSLNSIPTEDVIQQKNIEINVKDKIKSNL